MYGEDIDLSYRLTQGGWQNYYLPTVRILHYKGESTKRTSVNYVLVFYRAMVIFARKHFAPGRAGTFSALLNAAIWLRAGAAVAQRLATAAAPVLLDAGLLYAGMYALKNLLGAEPEVRAHPLPTPVHAGGSAGLHRGVAGGGVAERGLRPAHPHQPGGAGRGGGYGTHLGRDQLPG